MHNMFEYIPHQYKSVLTFIKLTDMLNGSIISEEFTQEPLVTSISCW